MIRPHAAGAWPGGEAASIVRTLSTEQTPLYASFFYYLERRVPNVQKGHRFTVEVGDVVPVTVGPMRSWFVR
jgi:hypothetical protein